MKICLTCKKEFKRNPKEGYIDWYNRKYCSMSCRSKSKEWMNRISNSKTIRFQEKDIKKMIKLYGENVSLTKISILFGCSRGTITRLLKRHGVKIFITKPHTIKNLGKYAIKGYTFTDKERKNLVESMKHIDFFGEHNPFYGKKHTLKTLLNFSKQRKEQWQDEEFKNKTITAQRKSMTIKPNKPETMMIKLFKQNSLPLHYVGDGQLVIGGKCPDFVCNPSKKVVLLHGDYWHYTKFKKDNPLLTRQQVEEKDINHYRKNFFDCLIIWEHELNNQKQVLNKIKGFLK